MIHKTVRVDGRPYEIAIKRAAEAPLSAPRLVIAGFQPTPEAAAVLRLCIESLRRFTTIPCELWVVDNCSPAPNAAWLEGEPGINVVFNRTLPREPRSLGDWLRLKDITPHAASYANGVALELGASVIDPGTEIMVTLHQDTMACHPRWLQYLLGKFDASCRSAGVRLDTLRVPALHILGMAFDFQLFKALGLSFRHDLPRHDVGDGISLGFTRAGYQLGACRNTYAEPRLIEQLMDARFKLLRADRALDDEGNVIFMHLGRGTLKSMGKGLPGKTTVEEWLTFGRRWLAMTSLATNETTPR